MRCHLKFNGKKHGCTKSWLIGFIFFLVTGCGSSGTGIVDCEPLETTSSNTAAQELNNLIKNEIAKDAINFYTRTGLEGYEIGDLLKGETTFCKMSPTAEELNEQNNFNDIESTYTFSSNESTSGGLQLEVPFAESSFDVASNSATAIKYKFNFKEIKTEKIDQLDSFLDRYLDQEKCDIDEYDSVIYGICKAIVNFEMSLFDECGGVMTIDESLQYEILSAGGGYSEVVNEQGTRSVVISSNDLVPIGYFRMPLKKFLNENTFILNISLKAIDYSDWSIFITADGEDYDFYDFENDAEWKDIGRFKRRSITDIGYEIWRGKEEKCVERIPIYVNTLDETELDGNEFDGYELNLIIDITEYGDIEDQCPETIL